jgi:hypothetical protein
VGIPAKNHQQKELPMFPIMCAIDSARTYAKNLRTSASVFSGNGPDLGAGFGGRHRKLVELSPGSGSSGKMRDGERIRCDHIALAHVSL